MSPRIAAVEPQEEKSVVTKSQFKVRKIRIDKYKPLGKSHVEKIAHFYHWAVEQYPGMYLDDSIIARATQGIARAGEDALNIVRNSRQRAKQILMHNYGMTIVSMRHVGTRATTSADDLNKTAEPAARQRAIKGVQNYKAVVNLIDPKQLTDGPDKDRFMRQRQERNSLFASPVFMLEAPKKS